MFLNSTSVTVGDEAKIFIDLDCGRIEGDVPVELIDAETKFNDPKAAKILREANFDAEKNAQVNEALLSADFANGRHARGHFSGGADGMMGNDQRKQFKEAKKAKNDNYIHLFNKDTKTFPVGLLGKVTQVLTKEGIAFSVEDRRKTPAREIEVAALLDDWEEKMRDYQREGADLTAKHPRLLFDWATNAGKTLLMAKIFVLRGVPTLVLTHSSHLAYQLRDAFRQYTGIEPSVCGAGKVTCAPITISVVNTASRHINEFIDYGFKMIMVDEAHRSAAASYVKVLKYLNPYYVYGFTGTAFRNGADNLVLEAVYGTERPKITNLEMIENGYSCKVEVNFTEIDQGTDCDKLDPYSLVYKDGIVESAKYNAAVIERIMAHVDEDRVIVVQVAHKKQGKLIYFMLRDLGVKVTLVDGDTQGLENYNKLQAFKAGTYQVAIGTVINEGFDHDGLDVVVNAAGYKAAGMTKQKLGRVLRMRDGKDKGFYEDFYSVGHPVLEKHSRKRAETLEKEGFVVPILAIVRKREADEKAKVAKEQEKANKKFDEVKKSMEWRRGNGATGKALAKSKFVQIKENNNDINI